MPEEVNRVVADYLSELLFCPTPAAVKNLEVEGLGNRAVLCGDVMYDAAIQYRRAAEQSGGSIQDRREPGAFALATIHRAENTNDSARLKSIFAALEKIARDECGDFAASPPHAQCAAKCRHHAGRC